MKLRPYQEGAIEAIFHWWNEGRGNALVVASTGAGKTIIFAHLIMRILLQWTGTRILVLAHRQELIEQTADKILKVWPDAPVGVYCAGLGRKEMDCLITVASRDSLVRNVDKLPTQDIVICDEAHNIPFSETSSYRKIFDALLKKNRQITITGFSATPYRNNTGFIYGNDANHIFSEPTFEIGLMELIHGGYLVPVTSKAVKKEAIADTSNVRTTAGDFNQGDLDNLMADERLAKACCHEWWRLAWLGGDARPTVFYCVSIRHAELVSEQLRQLGITAPVVHSDTKKLKKAEREERIRKFSSGEIHALVNVGILTEGNDIPRISCIALMRPTKSLGLFMQIVGRGLRLSPETGKTDCLLLDFGGCLERFGPVDMARPPSPRKKDPRVKTCESCGEILSIHARTCHGCGFKFMETPVKSCPVSKCGVENAVSAMTCWKCGYVFVQIESRAGKHAALSSELSGRSIQDQYQWFPVKGAHLSVHDAKSGNKCVRIQFVLEGSMLRPSKYLVWDRGSWQSNLLLRQMFTAGDFDLSKIKAEDFVSLWKQGAYQHHARKFGRILVDTMHKNNEVKQVEFSD